MQNRISKRVTSVPPSGIRKFFDIAATMDDVISLGIGEPDFVTPGCDPASRAGEPAARRDALHLQLWHHRAAACDHPQHGDALRR